MHDIGRRRAWVVWAVALSVYVLAVFHRSSLGVAGLLAADRFDITATQLAAFTVLQLLVYAGMQVPVGVAIDRYGPKKLLLAGLVLMTAGQLAFAFVTTFPLALLSRGVIGAGDAMIFTSVLRLVTAWFLVRQAPMVTQLTGQVGQLGAIAGGGAAGVRPAGVGLDAGLRRRLVDRPGADGRRRAAGQGLAVPPRGRHQDQAARAGPQPARRVGQPRAPGSGLWSHFVSQFSVTVFSMLWGYPFLVARQGLSPAQASALLMAMTGWVVVSGLLLGWLVTRYPYYRSVIVLCVVATMALMWAVVLMRTTPAPMWLLVLLVFAMASGGPASMVGFDLARSFTPAEASGRANGLVNIGGFSASLLTMALVGLVLDFREPAGQSAYGLDDFRVAMCVQYVFWGIGVFQVLRYRRKALAHLARVHPGAIEQLKRGETFVHPGIGDREGV